MFTIRQAKRVIIAVIGGTVLLLGIVLIVLPGPASLVIPAGLAILATEFAWAKHWLDKIRSVLRRKRKPSLEPASSNDKPAL